MWNLLEKAEETIGDGVLGGEDNHATEDVRGVDAVEGDFAGFFALPGQKYGAEAFLPSGEWDAGGLNASFLDAGDLGAGALEVVASVLGGLFRTWSAALAACLARVACSLTAASKSLCARYSALRATSCFL